MSASRSSSAVDGPRPSLGTVRVAGLMGFSDLMSELGANPKRLLAGCGWDPRALEEPDNVIPFSLGARLLDLAAKQTNCPHFGLLLGQRQDLSVLGPVGFLVRHSLDVRTAIQDLIRYMHLHVQGASAELNTDNALAQFSYKIHVRGLLGADQVYSVCMANKFNFMRLLCGKDWLPAEVHFRYPRPVDDSQFAGFFQAPVKFSQTSTSMFFDLQDLDRQTIDADPALNSILKRYIMQIEAKHEGDFCTQLRSVLRMLLPTGKCSVDRVAELFAMHRRTLHRQLAALGTTFEEMLDSLRSQIAAEMIKNTELSVGHIASAVGYRSPNAFNRAFNRWYGAPPKECRSSCLTLDVASKLRNAIQDPAQSVDRL